MKDQTAKDFMEITRLLYKIAQNDNQYKNFVSDMMKKISNKTNQEKDLNDNKDT